MKMPITGLALLLTCAAHSQNVYNVDFLTPRTTELKQTYPTNSMSRVKIQNINRFIYKVATEKTETDFNVTVPAMLTGIKLPAFLTKTDAQMAALPSPADKTANIALSAAGLEGEILDQINIIISVRKDLNKAILAHNDVVDISKSCTNDFNTIKSAAVAKIKTYLVASSASEPGDIAEELRTDVIDKIRIANNAYTQIEILMAAWPSTLIGEFRVTQHNFTNDLQKAKRELTEKQEELKKATTDAKKKQIKSEIDKLEEKIAGLTFSIDEGKEDNADTKKRVEEKVASAKALLAEINKFNEEGKVFTLADDIKKINEANYSYYSEMAALKKDETKFKFTVTADGQLVCNKPNEDKFEVTLRAKGGVKLDFSTGLFINFGKPEFRGQDFYYKPLSETTSSISTLDNKRKAILGIGALMHIYKRSPANFKLGFAVGASTTTSFDVVNFHAGPSFIIGDKDRFCITPGVTLREVKVLNSGYEINTVYDKNTLPEAVPTVTKFPIVGYFIAFTYNVSRFNK